MHQRPVFFDEKGQRRRWLVISGIATFLIGALVLFGFCLSLLFRPELPNLVRTSRGKLVPPPNHAPGLAYRLARQELMREIRKQPNSRADGQKEISVGFYAPWEETGIASLRAHADHLTHVAPQWLRLSPTGDGLDASDARMTNGSANAEIMQIAHDQHLKVVPILSNTTRNGFEPTLVHAILSSPARSTALIRAVASYVTLHRLNGLNLDFESLSPADEKALPAFAQHLRRALGRRHELSIDIPADADTAWVRELGKSADWIVLMAYDQHSESDPAGPIAATRWVQRQLDRVLTALPGKQVVLGVGSFAYDWPDNGKPAEALTYQEALANAQGFDDGGDPRKLVDFDGDDLNATYRYLDDQNQAHEVWMLDAPADYNAVRIGRLRNIHGFALWALGMEDPGVWDFLGAPGAARPDFGKVAFPYEVEHTGKGEILHVQTRPSTGLRQVSFDPATGLAVDEVYERFPSPYVIQHSGYRPKELSITFDDGPDPKATPAILDALKDLHVPATFFVIGQNVEQWPDLVRREVAEGHEVGGHSFTHPNLGVVGPMRANLELNATQRAIQSVTGRSTILFRPPYNADSEPRSPEEVRPVDAADQLGYVTVGEKIDPNDWKLSTVENGVERKKTAADIVQTVETQIAEDEAHGNEGNVILLHDGGGDRTETIKALKILVPELRAKGYKFVSTSALMGANRDRVMPPLATAEKLLIACDAFVFGGWFGLNSALTWLFVAALVLGFAKVFTVLALAVRQWNYERRHPEVLHPAPLATHRKVAVAIAAYNEERVIERTLRSILDSDYPLHQILVVDDGSTDATAEVARRVAESHPQILVIQKENGGKASALNVAIEHLTADFVVFVDADTLLDSHAITHLVSRFDSDQVAAVAGNVKVGNVGNILGLWQSMEYTSSQNLDRRAYAQLNAITVVPGAIGAWRASVLRELNGFESDTLAEDMDLTWRALGKGYEIRNETRSLAFTEVPETVSAFSRQRFRWAYGTLQCLFKHRSRFFQRSWFSWLVVPCVGLFQFAFQAIAPLIDLQVLLSIVRWGVAYASRFQTEDSMAAYSAASTTLALSLGLAVLFFLFEAFAASLAFRMEGAKAKRLDVLLWQRLAYRQLLYLVAIRALFRALIGNRQGWNKLDRTGTAKMGS